MFTGIVEELGTVRSIRRGAASAVLSVGAETVLSDLKIGDSVLLEGGGTLNWSMLEAGLVRRVQSYIAPKLLGGGDAKSPVEGQGAAAPDLGARLRDVTVTPLGEDFLLEGEVSEDVHGDH